MRLIDADKLIEKLEALADSYFYPNCSDFTMGLHDLLRQQGADAAIEVVRKQKSVDPVKHGHWEFVEKHFDGFKDFACSECGDITDVICVNSLPNFCKHCGAKMDMKDE